MTANAAPSTGKTSSTNSSPVNPAGMRWLAIVSAFAAMAVHAYLVKAHYDLHYGDLAGKLICDISSKFSCSATSASRWSELFGVPVALWGFLANAAFVILAFWDFLTTDEAQQANRTHLSVIAGVIAVASIVMGTITAVAINAICPFCLGTYVLSVLTAFGTWKGFRPYPGFKAKPSLAILVVACAALGFAANDQMRTQYGGPNGEAMTKAAIQEWTSNPVVTIEESDPLAMGPSRDQARMTLIEFADFRCIHCRHAAPPLKAFLSSHPDVRLEYYSWPLDGECNTSIQQNNGASCLLARIVWCARKKADKGWQAHETVFNRFEEWHTSTVVRDAIPSIAESIGASAEDMKACADSDEAKAAITKQAQLGTSLNIRGTPAIFVNGRSLPAGSSIPILNEAYRSIEK